MSKFERDFVSVFILYNCVSLKNDFQCTFKQDGAGVVSLHGKNLA